MSNDKNAHELLRWGLANSTAVTPGASVEHISADIQAGRRPDLVDPNVYEAIMGKSEAQMMREQLAVGVDASRTLHDRCTALDNFEMLIEQIDNANNITSMNMWHPIISLLSAAEAEIQTAAAWILGTAVHNNDKAQVAVLEFQPVSALLDLLHSGDEAVRAKAMYALSGLLKHNPQAMHQFDTLDGWKCLRLALVDPNLGLRRKTAFLINALLFQDPNSFDSIPDNTNHAEPTCNSTATPIAPVASSAPAGVPAAPLERGPQTMQTSIRHPNVARALLKSGILTTLISSLLPPRSEGVSHSDLPPPSGADGDTDPRTDLDFAEKSASAILSFISKLSPSSSSSASSALDNHSKTLLCALLTELESPPLDPNTTMQSRWAELSIDRSDFDTLRQTIQAL